MKILIFLARLALICNICFVAAQLLRYASDLKANAFYSTIIVLAYASLLLNIIVALAMIILFFTNKAGLKMFPRWLLIINFLFLIAQLYIFTA
jgi:hypothetical protein